jgi:hypothetical protein
MFMFRIAGSLNDNCGIYYVIKAYYRNNNLAHGI